MSHIVRRPKKLLVYIRIGNFRNAMATTSTLSLSIYFVSHQFVGLGSLFLCLVGSCLAFSPRFKLLTFKREKIGIVQVFCKPSICKTRRWNFPSIGMYAILWLETAKHEFNLSFSYKNAKILISHCNSFRLTFYVTHVPIDLLTNPTFFSVLFRMIFVVLTSISNEKCTWIAGVCLDVKRHILMVQV